MRESARHHPVYLRFATNASLYLKAMASYKLDCMLNEYRTRLHELVMVAWGLGDDDLAQCLWNAYDELDMMRYRARQPRYRRR